MKDLFGTPLEPAPTPPKSPRPPKQSLPPMKQAILSPHITNYRPYRVVKINKYETVIWNT